MHTDINALDSSAISNLKAFTKKFNATAKEFQNGDREKIVNSLGLQRNTGGDLHQTSIKWLWMTLAWVDALCPKDIENKFNTANMQRYDKRFRKKFPSPSDLENILERTSISFISLSIIHDEFKQTFARQLSENMKFIQSIMVRYEDSNQLGLKFETFLTKLAEALNAPDSILDDLQYPRLHDWIIDPPESKELDSSKKKKKKHKPKQTTTTPVNAPVYSAPPAVMEENNPTLETNKSSCEQQQQIAFEKPLICHHVPPAPHACGEGENEADYLEETTEAPQTVKIDPDKASANSHDNEIPSKASPVPTVPVTLANKGPAVGSKELPTSLGLSSKNDISGSVLLAKTASKPLAWANAERTNLMRSNLSSVRSSTPSINPQKATAFRKKLWGDSDYDSEHETKSTTPLSSSIPNKTYTDKKTENSSDSTEIPLDCLHKELPTSRGFFAASRYSSAYAVKPREVEPRGFQKNHSFSKRDETQRPYSENKKSGFYSKPRPSSLRKDENRKSLAHLLSFNSLLENFQRFLRLESPLHHGSLSSAMDDLFNNDNLSLALIIDEMIHLNIINKTIGLNELFIKITLPMLDHLTHTSAFSESRKNQVTKRSQFAAFFCAHFYMQIPHGQIPRDKSWDLLPFELKNENSIRNIKQHIMSFIEKDAFAEEPKWLDWLVNNLYDTYHPSFTPYLESAPTLTTAC